MHFDIFNNDAFSLMGLTASIQDAEYVPGRLGQLGLFEERGIPTTSVSIEKRGDTLALVPTAERGSSGKVYESETPALCPCRSVRPSWPTRSSACVPSAAKTTCR